MVVARRVKTVQTPPPPPYLVGPITTYNYDTNGFLTSIDGPVAGATTSFTYDAFGRTRTTTDSTGYTTTMSYDALDRVVKVAHPDGTFEQMEYEKLDMVGRRDRLGRWTRTLYDPMRRAISVKDPNNGVTTYQWCACGTMDALIDANGNKTSWEYDLQGRVMKEIRADGKVTSYSYEPTTSRLKTRTDRRGVVTTYDYHKDNQLERRTYTNLPGTVAPTNMVSYEYYPDTGLPKNAANGTDTLTWDYDGEDRMKSEQSSLNGTTVEWDYDPAGNRRFVKLGGTPFNEYTYDVTSRLERVRYKNTHNFDMAYDNSSRRTSLTYPNGIATSYTPYDAESRVTRINAKLGATNITDFTYGYNAAGNRTSKGTIEFAENYGYDSLDRLTKADRTAGTDKKWAWAYDKVGNRLAEFEGAESRATAANYNNMNQLTSTQVGGILGVVGSTNEPATVTVDGQAATTPASAGAPFPFQGTTASGGATTTFKVTAVDGAGNTRTNTYQVTGVTGNAATLTYDENGNLTQKVEGADTWNYVWDAENRLKEVKKNAATQATFRYDPSDRRVEKVAAGVTLRFVYDNEDWIRRTTTGGPTMDIIHGPGIDEPLAQDVGGTLTYFHADALGSIQKHTNSAGAVTATIQYDAWGNALVGTPGPYGFTGREPDAETGLHYYRARYYDSTLGRFVSEDPIPLPWRALAGVSGFDYAWDAPTRFTDPSGMAPPINCKARIAELTAAYILLLKRIAEQAAGRTDPKVVKNHEKSIKELLDRIAALSKVALKCGEEGRRAAAAAAAAAASRTVCLIVVPDICLAWPDLCCRGQYVGPGGVCVY